MLSDKIQDPTVNHIAKVRNFGYLAADSNGAKDMGGCFSQQWFSSLRGLRELFFPRRCIVCGRFLTADETDVCTACREDLPMTYQWDIVQNAAFERLARRFDVEAAATLFFFGAESDYRKIIYGIKYGGRRELARRMGFELGTRLAGNRDFRRCQAVIPVPLHPLRRWTRGYNQAEEIACGLAAALGVPPETALLRRSRYTKTQTRLHGAAKTKNVQGAFRIDPGRAEALQAAGVRHVLLVDDVLTSGSTLAACAAPLTKAGFRVACATLAFAGT